MANKFVFNRGDGPPLNWPGNAAQSLRLMFESWDRVTGVTVEVEDEPEPVPVEVDRVEVGGVLFIAYTCEGRLFWRMQQPLRPETLTDPYPNTSSVFETMLLAWQAAQPTPETPSES